MDLIGFALEMVICNIFLYIKEALNREEGTFSCPCELYNDTAIIERTTDSSSLVLSGQGRESNKLFFTK